MVFDKPVQATEFIKERREAASQQRMTLAMRIGTDFCYYEGSQWIQSARRNFKITETGRQLTNWNPDSNKFRATMNGVTSLIHKTSAATFPAHIEVDATPPDRDSRIEAAYSADVEESIVGLFVKHSRYLAAAQNANHRRCIAGTWGIGLSLCMKPRTLKSKGGQETTEMDQVLRAFDFDPTLLMLDPHCQSLDLWDHEQVVYSDVWSAEKIEREFGVKLDRDSLKTIGQLTPLKQEISRLSEYRLFSEEVRHSNTKGAVIYQVHLKDESGRFATMLIGVEAKILKGSGKSDVDEEIRWVNWDNQESPFGGSGLPLMLLHAHRRSDAMWSISDAALLKDYQDYKNVFATNIVRQTIKNAGYQWLIDDRSLGNRTIDSMSQYIHNYVGGYIPYNGGTRDRPANPPQLVQYPPVQAALTNLVDGLKVDMNEVVHRPPVTQGAVKSHVADASFQTAIEQADQVLGNRIKEDITRHEAFLAVGRGTMVRLAQQGSPSVLGAMRQAGFDEVDFAEIAQMNPVDSGATIKMRESSVRYRSANQRRADIGTMIQAQAMDPMELRTVFASDLDAPIIEQDRTYYRQCQRGALRILLGEEPNPIPMGKYNEMQIDAFRQAMHDRRARSDPATMDRLRLAIQAQYEMGQAEMMLAQPPAPAAPTTPNGDESQQPQEASLSSIIAAVEQSASPNAGVPQPVAA